MERRESFVFECRIGKVGLKPAGLGLVLLEVEEGIYRLVTLLSWPLFNR